VNVAWGLLLLEKYNRPEAARSFRRHSRPAPSTRRRTLDWPALSPTRIPLRRGVGAAGDHDQPDARRGTGVPREQALDDRRVTEAQRAIEDALAVNPATSRPCPACRDCRHGRRRGGLRGGGAGASGDQPALRPSCIASPASRWRGNTASRGVGPGAPGARVEPGNTRALADLGMYLMRTGDEARREGFSIGRSGPIRSTCGFQPAGVARHAGRLRDLRRQAR